MKSVAAILLLLGMKLIALENMKIDFLGKQDTSWKTRHFSAYNQTIRLPFFTNVCLYMSARELIENSCGKTNCV